LELFIPEKLKEKVVEWRESNYNCDYPTISEIFDYSFIENDSGLKSLRYLRKAQIEALETYWYLRIIEDTPLIFELYNKLYDTPEERLKALGIELSTEMWREIALKGKGIDYIFDKIKTDDKFVKKNKLESVRETLSLDYPSYILALAMGAGKTVLIGSIICTEFAMALEHGEDFVKNALVFAPGKTILGALKELSSTPYEKILPPRLYKQFMTSVKFTYTQDGQKDIPIIEGSSYYIVVTNTEKIRIQKPTGKKQTPLFDLKTKEKEEEKIEEANLRLRKIASLPNLAVFSDEAHHTYGQSLEKDLKKVRKTVNYLSEETNLIVVVNTTGTPYFKKQILKDVVYWYGLSQGISDGILKELNDSIYSYDKVTNNQFLEAIIEDFFIEYKDISINGSTKSKLAIYFPQTKDIQLSKPIIEKKLIKLGIDPSTIIEVNNKSDEQTKDFFNNRVNDPSNPYRVYLLVNMGTEGWNVPSLFASALARKLKTSNNFVLQAATRCLRQIPNNKQKARIYLSKDNVKILDNQLRETFNESLEILDTKKSDMIEGTITLRKTDCPEILIKKKVPRIVKKDVDIKDIKLTMPKIEKDIASKTVYDVRSSEVVREVLSQKYSATVDLENETIDLYHFALELSSNYRLPLFTIYEKLKDLYKDSDIPLDHLNEMRKQIEEQTSKYETVYEEIEVALALVKPNGFNKKVVDGKTVYTAEIIYHKSKADRLFSYEELTRIKSKELSFHYTPYNMDSLPEKDFLSRLLDKLDEDPDNIKGIYFTGAITDSNKTDFIFEYKDKSGKWRAYTPDFVLIKNDDTILIVEVKGDPYKDEQKEKALKEVEETNKDKIKYHIVSTDREQIDFEDLKKVDKWIYDK